MIVAIQLRFITPAALMERRKEEAFTRALVADSKHRQIPFALTWGVCSCLYGLLSATASGYLYDLTGASVHLVGLCVGALGVVASVWMLRVVLRARRMALDAIKVSRQAADIEAAMDRQSKGYR